ncbi:glycoside hydrolase superfamily [Xylariomycetidae sp. FL2044]|nr:glycoside hydrolase superfamily [Xylariomycetidae sp. FL2044]
MKYFLAAAAAAFLSQSHTSTAQNSTRGLIGNDGHRAVELGEWASAYQKAKAFAASLNLEQKAAIVTGGNATSPLDAFPGIRISDGQQGVLNSFFVSGWGQPAAITMSWDKQAIYDQARAIGTEFKIRGYHVCDGPTSSPVGRTPWSGRLAESYAADSYLNGIAFGLQAEAELDAGVIPGGKHFLLYEQETNRGIDTDDAYDVHIDDKALHETYLAPWYDAVKGGIGAAMCAMNRVNGTFSCESEPLVMGLLKEELGFPGFVVPDINAQKTQAGSANGGLDWASDQLWTPGNITELVATGQVSEARIDDMVVRNVMGWYLISADQEFPEKASDGEYRPIPRDHRRLIRANGAKSMVLLKNVNNALPLRSPRSLSVFGAHAGAALSGPNEAFSVFGVPAPTYSGHLATSGGAGSAALPYLVTPHMALTERAAEDGTQLRYILNDTFAEGATGLVASGPSTGVDPSIANYAQFAEACLVFLNGWGGEGQDRTELRNAAQDALVVAVAAECGNTVVVVNTVGPRILDAWVEHANVTAVLYGAPLGQESGRAIADVLYGDVNPSAALTYTIARTEDDYAARPCGAELYCPFAEGNYIDYKHFDRYGIEPRFEFGFGLSYSEFAYADLAIISFPSSSSSSSNTTNNTIVIAPGPATGPRAVGGRADLWDEVVAVSATIANAAGPDGAHVVQVYLTFPAAAGQPARQLRGFEKIALGAGESGTVEIRLRRRDISYWDVAAQEWAVAAGEYVVHVGASSRDFRLSGRFVVG